MIVILGPSGAGKSSQARELARRHQWQRISPGELLRQSPDPRIQETLKTGALIDDQLVVDIMLAAIKKADPKNQIVIDGFPRNIAQWELFNDQSVERKISKIIYVSVDKTEAAKRLLKRARGDDSIAATARKWDVFEKQTIPLIDLLKKTGQAVEVDGEGDFEAVTERIERAVSDNH